MDIIHHYLYLILFITGFSAATVDAIAGGGGLISLPVLLGIGLPPYLALGTNKLQSSVGTVVAAFSYYRRGYLEKDHFVLGFVFTLIGAALGAITIQFINSELLKKGIPFFLLIILIYMFFSPRLGEMDQHARMKETYFLATFGVMLGFYDGFLGPGVGSFWVFLVMYFLGKNLVKATAYTKVFNANTNIMALICFALTNNVDYKIGACMLVGQLIGGRLGAHLAMKKGATLIRPLFMLVVSATIVTLIYKNFGDVADFINQLDFITFCLVVAAAVFFSILLIWRKLKKPKMAESSDT